MSGRITSFLRNYVIIFSIIFIIAGLITFLMGVLWYGLGDMVKSGDLNLGVYTNTIKDLGDWNFYLLAVGFILLAVGIWYLYSFLKNRKLVLEGLETKKRSEFIKKHNEIKNIAKHLPSKYQKMLSDKEQELRIK